MGSSAAEPLVICSLIRTFAADYEKSRNEKSRNMENPFKFERT